MVLNPDFVPISSWCEVDQSLNAILIRIEFHEKSTDAELTIGLVPSIYSNQELKIQQEWRKATQCENYIEKVIVGLVGVVVS